MTTSAAVAVAVGQLHPLNEFYRRRGRTLPAAEALAPGDIPEPQRGLLVHDRDMTGTLERFHGDTIRLRLLNRWRDGAGSYWRESALELERTGGAVEYGAIQIHLELFPEPWRSEILAERRPLGSLLNASAIAYTSRPTAFFKLAPDDFIAAAFRLERPDSTYGRQNTLRNAAGQALAEIVEVLPPWSGGPAPLSHENQHQGM